MRIFAIRFSRSNARGNKCATETRFAYGAVALLRPLRDLRDLRVEKIRGQTCSVSLTNEEDKEERERIRVLYSGQLDTPSR